MNVYGGGVRREVIFAAVTVALEKGRQRQYYVV
jgi:hypothetical protein